MTRCKHYAETQAVADANPGGIGNTYPKFEPGEVQKCDDPFHDAWKIINGVPLPDRAAK